eukprot:CAMPEP_0201666514 /NCGR_PEP_ID=MMETSP0494-20130426/8627_1 /ASSEMBLY_ACC=CAM_ASM_000839 /TAXON_ID=420259 /ORGANISM="Thalassiosira gravida, Strain GMp14c1" /LENGTH=139 /DNA_ID=CAMNT_0048145821 /DNA_START=179 /DNA_END=594 /DNA_ORIENTATION=-
MNLNFEESVQSLFLHDNHGIEGGNLHINPLLGREYIADPSHSSTQTSLRGSAHRELAGNMSAGGINPIAILFFIFFIFMIIYIAFSCATSTWSQPSPEKRRNGTRTVNDVHHIHQTGGGGGWFGFGGGGGGGGGGCDGG